MTREIRGAGRRRRGPGPVQRRRSAETREKVIRAAIGCIAEEGFRRATTTRIAKRAGVSRGAMQHQFADRAAILDEVLERVLREFRAQLASFSTRATSLGARAGALVDASWNLIREPTYRAYREILRNHPLPGAESLAPEHVVRQVTAAVETTIVELFADLRPSKRTVGLVSAVLFATLNGVDEQQHLAHYPSSVTRTQLSVLRDTILRLVSEGIGSRRLG